MSEKNPDIDPPGTSPDETPPGGTSPGGTPPGVPSGEHPSILTPDPSELPGEGYRKDQIARWLYVTGARSFEEMTNLPREMREELAGQWRISAFDEVEAFESSDGSIKFLYTLPDGMQTEAVYMPYTGRTTLCISSQVGCPAGCTFCATGKMGFGRNLEPHEILDQILAAAAHQGHPPEEIRNIVLMGMGEPLLNFEGVSAAVARMIDPDAMDLSPRRITLSTVGIPKGIYRLAEEDLGVRLALSLHAPDDETRRRIIPTAHRFGIDEIMAAVRHYFDRVGRRVTVEYTMLNRLNDHDWQAERLAGLLQGLSAHVNLIPWNPWEGAPVAASPEQRIQAFQTILESEGVPVSVRWSRGRDVGAACGQLALKNP